MKKISHDPEKIHEVKKTRVCGRKSCEAEKIHICSGKKLQPQVKYGSTLLCTCSRNSAAPSSPEKVEVVTICSGTLSNSKARDSERVPFVNKKTQKLKFTI